MKKLLACLLFASSLGFGQWINQDAHTPFSIRIHSAGIAEDILAYRNAKGGIALQGARSVTTPYSTPATLNYYVATTGNDSNPCTSASKCLTLAHVLKLIPPVLDANYIVNVADGTYAEPIDTSGFLGTGLFNGPHTTSLKILGNTGTPANVVFSGTVSCLPDYSGYTSTACISGSAHVILSGLKVTNSSHYGIICQKGILEYISVTATMSGVAADESVSAAHFACDVVLSGTNLFSGFSTDVSPTRGIGFYASTGTQVALESGTTTITGPGTGTSASAFGTYCFVLEQGSGTAFQMHGSSTLASSGCQIGIIINDNASFSAFDGGATIALSNGSTAPTTSQAIVTNGGGTINLINTTVTLDRYTFCVVANQYTTVSTTGGTATLTNCGTAHAGTGNIIGF